MEVTAWASRLIKHKKCFHAEACLCNMAAGWSLAINCWVAQGLLAKLPKRWIATKCVFYWRGAWHPLNDVLVGNVLSNSWKCHKGDEGNLTTVARICIGASKTRLDECTIEVNGVAGLYRSGYSPSPAPLPKWRDLILFILPSRNFSHSQWPVFISKRSCWQDPISLACSSCTFPV